MIVVDTSLWLDHLRGSDSLLASLLVTDFVCIHPWIIGELACGNLQNRRGILGLLMDLPQIQPVSEGEALYFIEQHHLMGKGIGYIDAHLLAATAVHSMKIWTRDKRLNAMAHALDLAYTPKSH
ncbi:MAG: type II toxin-antitoxin system VapC family toxin [Methylovulum sp.]|nr:type II toxin-antitoxin system VapC family toxin [Methylovulum sp.]